MTAAVLRSAARRLSAAAAMALLILAAPPAAAQETEEVEGNRRAGVLKSLPELAAKRVFGSATSAAPMAARAIGNYARGCVAGAKAIAIDGDAWQVMRMSRNRNWGHPDLIALVERLAKKVPGEAGWDGLLIGDISQPRGGPMLTGHASHQIGLDADIWLTPMPQRRLNRSERENMSAVNMAASSWLDVDPKAWTENHTKVIRAAARESAVARIFINPVIKKALCREAGSDRGWLTKVRPMWGHNYHFHIRIRCPAGSPGCDDQDPPPDGDGCGGELDGWIAKQHKAMFAPKRPGGGKAKPPPVLMLDALPAACREVAFSR